MKCLECKWDDSNAPRQGKCCGECGLCPLCEQFTLYKKTTLTGSQITELSLGDTQRIEDVVYCDWHGVQNTQESNGDAKN